MGFSTGGYRGWGRGGGSVNTAVDFSTGRGGGGGGHPSGGFNPKDFSFVLEIVGRHELLPD